MPLKAILFDLDDTLYDHQHSSRSALAAIYVRYDALRQISLDELARQHAELIDYYHGFVLRGELSLDEARLARFTDLLGRFGMSDSAALAQIVRLYRETYTGSERLIAGAVALLERLRAVGLKIALVTNNTTAEQMGKLERLGLLPLFDVLAISEAVGVAKPDPRIFAVALDQLGCTADEVVMVGDSWSADILGAQAAGIRAVWLNRYGRACPDSALAQEITALDALDACLLPKCQLSRNRRLTFPVICP